MILNKPNPIGDTMRTDLAALESNPDPTTLESLISQAEAQIGSASRAQDEIFNVVSPRGNFTPQGFSPLVDALNIALPLFGQPTLARVSEPSQTIPDPILRPFMMIVTAINDAVSDSVLPQELAIHVANIVSDNDLKMIAAKIGSAAKSMSFKKYLKESPSSNGPTEESVAQTKPMNPAEMDDEAIQELFRKRA